jgi:LAO/AO transport system kinase
VWETVLRHRQCFLGSGELATLRLQQEVDWMWSLVHQGLRQRLEDNRAVREMLPGITKQVARGELSPLAATEQLLDGAFPAEVCRTKGDAYENP